MTKEDLQQIAELLQPIHEELAELRTDVRHTRMLIEKQEHNVQLIAEQYTDIAEKLDKANDRAAQLDDMRTRLRTLETVVMNHTAAIKELRKAE
ncbi:MAG: hypothetical protein DBY17_08080 [Oscillospiraceae bacterium]|nr:MAG: hypothetical protein DBY17_08080 [Oscillospiraceae bacterium]